ncbi:molybdopterin converting factor subunit 1 [Leucothrix mucor]|uniref:molybdopterin converting factor subunit 1 n=1 Tax=Leucothrix mucor TaxID=45248 RepID=UPI0003B4048D|nr:molybdopterin converting factor subunit 1 [Leucothrix mucor]
MTVKVLYFASLRELVGHPSTTIALESPQTVESLWSQVNPDIERPEACLVAVNQEYADLQTLINDGDEVAFFPQVTGG